MRAFVVSDDSSLSFQLRNALAQMGCDCPAAHVFSLSAAVGQLPSLSNTARAGSEPDLFFVVVSSDLERAIAALRVLRRLPQTSVFAVGPATDPKLVLRILREGAHEYLDQADLSEELTASLDRLRDADAQQPSAARVIALLPASGGCGCSTVAASLAAALAKSSGACVLLDLNAEFGDLATLLDLKPTHTLAELCRNIGRLDRSLLEGALIAHASGVKLLAAPARIADGGRVTADGVQRILSLATESAPFVVADLPHCLRAEALQALSQADVILLVLRLDFASLRNARRLLEYLQEVGQFASRIQIVVNRHRQPGELPAADAEAALGAKINHFLYDDPKAINRTNNNGVPIVLQAPTAKLSAQITALAVSLKLSNR